MRRIICAIILFAQVLIGVAQDTDSEEPKMIDYSRVKEYVISDIKVTGVKYLNPTHLTSISGLHKGKKIKIPGSDISTAIKKYWKHGLFADVQIVITKMEGSTVDLEIRLKEQPRLNRLYFTGVKKSEQDDLKEKLEMRRGTQITENVLNNAKIIISRHFIEKGFFNIDVFMKQKEDTASENRVNLYIHVNKKDKVKIQEVVFEGNEVYPDKRLRRVFKKTKQIDLNIFKGSKYIEADYKEDKTKLIDFYNESGYRDAKIEKEEIYKISDNRIGLKINIYEGNKYYIRSMKWVGNTKYPAAYLTQVLGVKRKDIYDKKMLEERLSLDEDAVSTLYMDNGFLFFSVTPVETRVEGDSVDLEFRMYEGDPATISQIIIKGNTKTNEHVIRRELYTRPGELFSKSDLMRSYREVASLGHFNPESIGVNPLPNQADGTVDIEYALEERPNDQLELSGGWGGSYGFVGSVGVKFTNLALGKMFNPEAWRPVPTGDGQTLSLRAQSNLIYHGLNASFMEPWFGGKKPNSFTVGLNYTRYKSTKPGTRGFGKRPEFDGSFTTMGGSMGLGKRLKWPDDYFTLYGELSYNRYMLNNFSGFALSDGGYNLLSLKGVLARSSQDQPIYPRKGSNISLSLQITPPYSAFNNKDYSQVTAYERFKNIEFHKWKFNAAWYKQLVGDLVLAIKTEFASLGYFNKDIGHPIFEKFDLGGSGLSGYSLYATEVVALRGYTEGALTPYSDFDNGETISRISDGNIYTRYYAELRYPITLNPSATLYGLAFIEGGNIWKQWQDFNPYDIKRSAGIGIRAFLPMFGLLGFDWGYGFDKFPSDRNNGAIVGGKGEFHFIIGQQF